MNGSRLLDLAIQQYGQGNLSGAIDSLKRVLSQDPDSALAHAVLSGCLLDSRRVHAAEVEADIALSIEPELSFAHHMKALCLCANRKFEDALRHMTQTLELDPDDPDNYCQMAHVLQLSGGKKNREQARKYLDQALQLDPNGADTLSAIGNDELSAGHIDQAESFARQALTATPEHLRALVLMGRIYLRRGEVDKAYEHAIWALKIDASDEGALHLIAAVKARKNIFIGLWWRYATWMGELGSKRAILILIGMFIVYRLSTFALGDLGHPDAANLTRLLWIAFCIYTWVGPGLFKNMIAKEVDSVMLKDF